MRPALLMDIAGGEALSEVPVSDVLQDRLGGRQLALMARAIDAPGMALQVVRGSQCLEQGALGNQSLPTIGEMIHQCQGRDELAIFREMALKGRREVTGMQPP